MFRVYAFCGNVYGRHIYICCENPKPENQTLGGGAQRGEIRCIERVHRTFARMEAVSAVQLVSGSEKVLRVSHVLRINGVMQFLVA